MYWGALRSMLLTRYIQMIRVRRMRWVGHVACMGEKKHAEGVLVEKPERKRPSGIHRHR